MIIVFMSYYVQYEAVIHFCQLNFRSLSSLGGSLGAWCSDDTDADKWFQIAPMHDYVRRVNFTNKPRL